MPAAERDIPTKIFLGNLSIDTDENKLKEVFGKMGPITQILLMRDRETGLSRCFGFITYENVSDAKDAVSRLNDTDLDGKVIKVDLALKGLKQQVAARGGASGRGMGMERGRGGFRGRGGPPASRGRGGYDSAPSGPPLGRGGPLSGRGGGPLSGRGGGLPGRGVGPPGRGVPRGGRGGPPSRGGHPASGGHYPALGGPERDSYARGGKEPLLSAPPSDAMGDYGLRGYERGYEREPDPRRDTLLPSRGAPISHMPEYDRTPRSAYGAEEAIPPPRRRAYPEDEYGAAPAAARPSRGAYNDPDPYARERYPPPRDEPPSRGYPERDGYGSRETRDPYAPSARDSYSTAAASRPSYDYSLPATREAPVAQREYPPATARTASRYDEERVAPISRGYERPPMREYSEAGYSRDYDREAVPSRPTAYSDQYPRASARPAEHDYPGAASTNPRYDPYATRESYPEARTARPTEKSPYGARDSYGVPSAGGRGAYPAERAARPVDRGVGGVPPARAPLSARAPPPSRGYERY